MQNIESFTNLYSLTKVVKFELCPIPETEKWMKVFGKIFSEKNVERDDDNFFATDLNIVEAKQVIQDVLNTIHENIINKALKSDEAKTINIFSYYELAKQRNADLSEEEKRLREEIEKCFVKPLKEFYDRFSMKKDSKKKDKDVKLSDLINASGDAKMLDYISEKAGEYTSTGHNIECIQNACKVLKGYWGVLSQFIENRKNYYVFDKEQDTAVATRIVSDLLPVFCKNCRQYKTNQAVYDSIEGFDSTIYCPDDFHKYVYQSGIEAYNVINSENNSVVNLYNQQRKKKTERVNGFVGLHKQIGCKGTGMTERVQICKDWDATKTEDAGISLEAKLRDVIQLADEIITPQTVDIEHPRLCNLLFWLEGAEDWEGLYVSDKALRVISSRYLEDWSSLERLLVRERSVGTFNTKKELGEQFKLNSAVELSPVFRALDREDFNTTFKKSVYEEYHNILDSNLPLSRNLVNMLCYDVKQKINKELSIHALCIKELLTTKLSKEHREGFFQQEENIDIIKNYLDVILFIIRFVGFFSVRQNKIKGAPYNMELLQIVSSLLGTDLGNPRNWYDEIRNYLLRLPQDEVKNNKLKLNFNSSQLLKGWHVNKTKDRLSVILKNDEALYLCILQNTKSCRTLFDIADTNPIYVENSEAYRMSLSPMTFATILKKYKPMFGHNYTEETNEVDAIQRAKKMIREKWLTDIPDLEEAVENNYNSKNEFQKDVEKVLQMDKYSQCRYIPIDWNLVKQHAEKGEMYVFKIHSKDYKETSKGKRNLQTIYWDDVLSGHSQHRLSAYGEIFRREAVSEDKRKPFVHKKGSILVNKRFADGNPIPDRLYNIISAKLNNRPIPQVTEAKDVERAQSLIDGGKIVSREAWKNITKDARFYSGEKYFLHNPICLNYKTKSFDSKAFSQDRPYYAINPIIQEHMHDGGISPAFIGIDRGEKHLVYACKINAEEVILSCNHYDTVNGIDYLAKLEERADTRLKAKQSWKQQDSIKNLKDGYISHVVHQLLTDAIPLDNADACPSFIVLEKLSREMKRGRQKIEKQVYQKFELALANKLSFYVSKDVEEGLPGSIQMPLQFVPPVNTFEQIDKKDTFGIMLYTRANYTSVTDPLTGWRKTIYIANGNNDEIKSQLRDAFLDIRFEGKDYVFSYIEKNTGHRWDMYSGIDGKSLDRFEYNKNTRQYDAYDIVKVLDGLFDGFDKSASLLEQINNGIELKKIEESRTAYESLRKAINMIQQIRNTGNKKEDDNFLLSPVRASKGDAKGKHFDTRYSEEFGNLVYIRDADANGAFNVARKGLIMDAHYKYWAEHVGHTTNVKGSEGKDKLALSSYVSDREWDLWLLDRDKWKEHLSEFALRTQD